MRVARLHGAHDLRLHDEPVPVPGPGEALVRVTAVGICGSDLHWLGEGGIGADRVATPFVLGHEAAGVIESGPRRGERVAIDPAIACGRCEDCERGDVNICRTLRFAGHVPEGGAMAEYLVWPERCLVPVPPALSDAEAALLEPLGVGLYAVELGRVGPGGAVAVFGCGPIGLCILQVARAAGATALFATDLPACAHRLELARAYGATPLEGGSGGEVDRILAGAAGRGVDVAFEAAGDAEAVEAAVAAVRPGGRVILVGIPGDDRIAVSASLARRKDLELRVVHRMKHTYPRAIRLVASGRVDLKSLVTHSFPLTAVVEAFQVALTRAGVKVVLEPA